MAFDNRDCRLDVILGDDDVPDNMNLPAEERDVTCAWVDFVDNQYNPRINRFGNTDTESVTASTYSSNKATIIVSKKTGELL